MERRIVEILSPEGIALFEAPGRFKYDGKKYAIQIEILDKEKVVAVGCCRIASKQKRLYEIGFISVDPEYRKSNLGASIVTSLVALSKVDGAAKVIWHQESRTQMPEEYYKRVSTHYRHIASFRDNDIYHDVWEADCSKLDWDKKIGTYDWNNAPGYLEEWKARRVDGKVYYDESRGIALSKTSKVEVTRLTKAKVDDEQTVKEMITKNAIPVYSGSDREVDGARSHEGKGFRGRSDQVETKN